MASKAERYLNLGNSELDNGDYEKALHHSIEAKQFQQFCPGQLWIYEFEFISLLIQFSLYFNLTDKERVESFEQIEIGISRMKTLADVCPENYLGQCYLVEAEKHRILGKLEDAMNSYEKAIRFFKDNV